MAWEITKGLPPPGSAHQFIHVIGADQFDGAPTGNPDLTPKFVQTELSGVSSGEKASGLQLHGDGMLSTSLNAGHGFVCIGQAIAAQGDGPMIGTCPECVGMALNWFGTKPWQIDVDGVAGNGITVPEVQWSSAEGLAPSD